MTEHTKLPWRVEQDTDLIWGACDPDDNSSRGMGYSIVSGQSGAWCRGNPDMDEREANAAFIVKAVNNHVEMDRLLAEAADFLNASPTIDGMDIGAKITAFRLAMQKCSGDPVGGSGHD